MILGLVFIDDEDMKIVNGIIIALANIYLIYSFWIIFARMR